VNINDALGPVPYYIWIALAYQLGLAVAITVSGRMMDIWGRRWIMVTGNILGVVGCIVSGTAHSVGVVIAGLAITGIGGGIQQQTNACVVELIPMKWRPQICGFTAFSVLVPGFFGTPIGTSSFPSFC
jgi:MFS family permease